MQNLEVGYEALGSQIRNIGFLGGWFRMQGFVANESRLWIRLLRALTSEYSACLRHPLR